MIAVCHRNRGVPCYTVEVSNFLPFADIETQNDLCTIYVYRQHRHCANYVGLPQLALMMQWPWLSLSPYGRVTRSCNISYKKKFTRYIITIEGEIHLPNWDILVRFL